MSAAVHPIPPPRFRRNLRQNPGPADLLPFPLARSPGFVAREAGAIVAAGAWFVDRQVRAVATNLIVERLRQGFTFEAANVDATAVCVALRARITSLLEADQ